ncbi:MAG TPA: fibrobacter succinogenes major paralogous domain-containing protein [Bacteroidales bacterium]|nr:fibrobacter succinogenes major paralogous domain-containing protein [Bacteroidales bacterium]HRZ48053.1 fibrobacter succinogenes major paralogous domain-containing protein [Bacteroidales bacterium]
MKTFTLLFMMFLACVGQVSGQTISLTFTATLNGNHQPLDSISIENLTQGGDTTLYGNDTVLLLQQSIGTEQPLQGPAGELVLFPPSPNPFPASTSIQFYLARQELVTLRVSDLSGREVAGFSEQLQPGVHHALFHAGEAHCYLLSVETPHQKQVRNLISMGNTGGACRLEYTGGQPGASGLRISQGKLPWAPGDNLRFIGHTANGADTIVAQPVQSTQYTFLYSSGICPSTVIDINGNIYNTVQIGTQCWMKENLKARNYRNGTTIPNITDYSGWAGLSTGARCWCSNDSSTYAATYGALYNWYAVDNSNALCPTGWHVPTDAEWTILADYLGGESVAGGALKEAGTAHWYSPNTGATNSSGFTALPGGIRIDYDGSFDDLRTSGYWWSSSAYQSTSAWHREMFESSTIVHRIYAPQRCGFSVRCVRD